MNFDQVQELARRIARERGISQEQALSELGKHGSAARQRAYAVLHPTRSDRAAFSEIEQPRRPFWWQKEDA